MEFNDFLKKRKTRSFQFSNLESALESALKDSLKEKKEINILFSPACSSFDQFKNFEHRGKFFKKHLNKFLKMNKLYLLTKKVILISSFLFQFFFNYYWNFWNI